VASVPKMIKSRVPKKKDVTLLDLSRSDRVCQFQAFDIVANLFLESGCMGVCMYGALCVSICTKNFQIANHNHNVVSSTLCSSFLTWRQERSRCRAA
jgi:hypothetical protein